MLLNLTVISFIATLYFFASTIVAPEPSLEQDDDHRVRRVVGGDSVKIMKYPFATHISWYLVRKYKKTRRIICSGVVLNKDFVLTAASCFEPLVRENYSSKNKTMNREIQLTKYQKTFVRAGTVNGSRVKLYEHQERKGVTLYIHSEYLHVSTMFDVNIALIRVHEPFDLSSFFVKAASLAKKSGPRGEYVNNYCVGVGFGYSNIRNANFSATPDPAEIDLPETYYKTALKQFKVKAASSWFCRNLEKNLTKKIVHFDSFYLCAISKNIRGFEHNCDGDIGGALVCGGLVVGILSQTREKKPCDISGPSFSMYAGVGESVVYDWLKKMIPDISQPIEIPFEDHIDAVQWYPDEPEDLRRVETTQLLTPYPEIQE